MSLPIEFYTCFPTRKMCENVHQCSMCQAECMSSKLAHTQMYSPANTSHLPHTCECSPNLTMRTQSTATGMGSPSHVFPTDTPSESPSSSTTEMHSPSLFWSPRLYNNVTDISQDHQYRCTPLSFSTHTHTHDSTHPSACQQGNKGRLMITPTTKKSVNNLTPATVSTATAASTTDFVTQQQQTLPTATTQQHVGVSRQNRGSLAHATFYDTHEQDQKEFNTPFREDDDSQHDDTQTPNLSFRVGFDNGTFADLFVVQHTQQTQTATRQTARTATTACSHTQRSTTSDGLFEDVEKTYVFNSEMSLETPEFEKLLKKTPPSVTRMKTTHFSRSLSTDNVTSNMRCRSAPADVHTFAHTDTDVTLQNARLALNFCYKNVNDTQNHNHAELMQTIPDPDTIRISYVNDDNVISNNTTTAYGLASQLSFDMSPRQMGIDVPTPSHTLSLPPLHHQDSSSPELRARSASVSGPSLLLGLPSRNYEYDYALWGYKHVSVMSCAPASSTHFVRAIKTDELLIAKVIDLTIFKPQEREQVMQEAKILRRMNNPYIVTYKDSFIKDNTLIIIMEYCEGGDLFNYLHEAKVSGRKLSEEQILSWLGQICLGVEYIHSNHILHCDLKTTNIFLTKNGDIKIGDFGIARELRANKTCLSPQRCPNGTLMYMSPEMCSYSSITEKSDQWAVGCILYEMCTLKHAFQVQSVAQLKKTHLDTKLEDTIAQDNFAYSDLLKNLILKMLMTEPEKRPTVTEVMNKILSQPEHQELMSNIMKTNMTSKFSNSQMGGVELIRTSTIPLELLFPKESDKDCNNARGGSPSETVVNLTREAHTTLHTHRHTQKWAHKRAAKDSDSNSRIPSPCLSTRSTVADSVHMSDADTCSPLRLHTQNEDMDMSSDNISQDYL